MIARGGSYMKKDGKLIRVGGTEEPQAPVASGGASSLPQAEAARDAASASSTDKPGRAARKGA